MVRWPSRSLISASAPGTLAATGHAAREPAGPGGHARAVRSGPELVIELRVRGGDVALVPAPGTVVDANELAVRYTKLTISRDARDNTPGAARL
jgi:hypothetical protein